MEQIGLNQLPTPTYRWLGVNETTAVLPAKSETEPQWRIPEQVQIHRSDVQNLNIPSGCGDEFSSEIQKLRPFSYSLSGSSDQPVHVQIPNNGLNEFHINVQRGEAMTVIMHISPENTALRSIIHADAYAKIKLVQIIQKGHTISDISAEIAENAQFDLVQIFLETDRAISGTAVTLDGRNSVFTSNIGYLLDNKNALDMNLNIIHNGKRSESRTDVKGVLRGSSEKTFRGTIDFRSGASGAKGAEREDVLLMNKQVQNKTVPVILCAEEDVEGSHGASIGQIDASHVFYMQSRGIPEDRIAEIIAQSKLGTVIRAIGDAETERVILKTIGMGDTDE